MTNRLVISSIAVIMLLVGGSIEAGPAGHKKILKKYRGWVHTKSMVIPDKSHALYGFHNIYANSKALKANLRGKTYPEGSVFVVAFYDVVNKDGTVNQGSKTMDALMIKDQSATDTGGWTYAAYGADGSPKGINPAKDCFECHKQAKANDYVFHKVIR